MRRPRWRSRLARLLRTWAETVDPVPTGLDLSGAPPFWADRVRAAAREQGGLRRVGISGVGHRPHPDPTPDDREPAPGPPAFEASVSATPASEALVSQAPGPEPASPAPGRGQLVFRRLGLRTAWRGRDDAYDSARPGGRQWSTPRPDEAAGQWPDPAVGPTLPAGRHADQRPPDDHLADDPHRLGADPAGDQPLRPAAAPPAHAGQTGPARRGPLVRPAKPRPAPPALPDQPRTSGATAPSPRPTAPVTAPVTAPWRSGTEPGPPREATARPRTSGRLPLVRESPPHLAGQDLPPARRPGRPQDRADRAQDQHSPHQHSQAGPAGTSPTLTMPPSLTGWWPELPPTPAPTSAPNPPLEPSLRRLARLSSEQAAT